LNVVPQVDFKVDIADAKAARTEIDWNSKKAGEYKLASLPFHIVRGVCRLR